MSSASKFNTFNQHQQYMGHRPMNPLLNAQNLQMLNQDLGGQNIKERFMEQYLNAINAGYNCFWCIPTAEGDTQYVAFLLIKESSKKPVLDEALLIAQQIAKQHG